MRPMAFSLSCFSAAMKIKDLLRLYAAARRLRKESLVHFDDAGEPVAAGTNHGAAQLVQHPGGVIAARPAPLQPSALTPFLVHHIPHRLKPQAERLCVS